MNILPAKVLSVSEPYEKYNLWIVDVKYNCYGSDSTTKLPYKTQEEALKNKPNIGDEIYI